MTRMDSLILPPSRKDMDMIHSTGKRMVTSVSVMKTRVMIILSTDMLEFTSDDFPFFVDSYSNNRKNHRDKQQYNDNRRSIPHFIRTGSVK